MKVIVSMFDAANENRARELIGHVSDAYKVLSPKNVREASRGFVKYIEELGFAACILDEDEWKTTLSEVRRICRGFNADYILSDADAGKLVEVAGKLPEPLKQILAAHSTDGYHLVWLPLDEEALDGTGL